MMGESLKGAILRLETTYMLNESLFIAIYYFNVSNQLALAISSGGLLGKLNV